MLKMPYNPEKIVNLPSLDSRISSLKMFKAYKFMEQPDSLSTASRNELDSIYSDLTKAQCLDNREECEVLIKLLESESEAKSVVKLQKRLMVVYKKLAFKKYREIFEEVSNHLHKRIQSGERNFTAMELKLQEIDVIAKMRFEG